MREAIGGTWIIGIVMGFIVIFSGYLAVSVNYTKAFKVKNRIINIIEESEGFTESTLSESQKRNINYLNSKYRLETEEKILVYLDSIGYAYTLGEGECTKAGRDAGTMYDNSYCIKKICAAQGGAYYKVTSFIKFEIPIIYANFTIPITGETKTLYNNIDNLNCSN